MPLCGMIRSGIPKADPDGNPLPDMDGILVFLDQLFVSGKLLSAEAARLAQCRFLQFFGGIRLFFFRLGSLCCRLGSGGCGSRSFGEEGEGAESAVRTGGTGGAACSAAAG